VITSMPVIPSLVGFEVVFPFVERFLRLDLGLSLGSGMVAIAGFSAPKSVITSLAGFGGRRPPTGQTHGDPSRFQVLTGGFTTDAGGFWICCSGQPSRPSAKTCCFFSSFKTLAMPTEVTSLHGCECPGCHSRWPVFR
jgi:hypothetical protein